MIITKEEQIQKLPVSGKKEMHSLACLRELKLILTASGAKIFKFRYENKLTGDRTTKTLGEYRQGVYSIKEARNDAIKLLMYYQETGSISKEIEFSYSDLWTQWRKQRASRTDIKHIRFKFDVVYKRRRNFSLRAQRAAHKCRKYR